MQLRINNKFAISAAAAVFAVAAWLLVIRWTGSGTLCVMRTYTGMPCPGCGLGHALIALLHGDFSASLVFHPLLLPLAALFPVLAICLLKPELFAKFNRLWIGAAVLLTVFYLVRLVIYFPAGPYPMIYSHNNVIEKVCGLLFHTCFR